MRYLSFFLILVATQLISCAALPSAHYSGKEKTKEELTMLLNNDFPDALVLISKKDRIIGTRSCRTRVLGIYQAESGVVLDIEKANGCAFATVKLILDEKAYSLTSIRGAKVIRFGFEGNSEVYHGFDWADQYAVARLYFKLERKISVTDIGNGFGLVMYKFSLPETTCAVYSNTSCLTDSNALITPSTKVFLNSNDENFKKSCLSVPKEIDKFTKIENYVYCEYDKNGNRRIDINLTKFLGNVIKYERSGEEYFAKETMENFLFGDFLAETNLNTITQANEIARGCKVSFSFCFFNHISGNKFVAFISSPKDRREQVYINDLSKSTDFDDLIRAYLFSGDINHLKKAKLYAKTIKDLMALEAMTFRIAGYDKSFVMSLSSSANGKEVNLNDFKKDIIPNLMTNRASEAVIPMSVSWRVKNSPELPIKHGKYKVIFSAGIKVKRSWKTCALLLQCEEQSTTDRYVKSFEIVLSAGNLSQAGKFNISINAGRSEENLIMQRSAKVSDITPVFDIKSVELIE